MRRKRIRAFQPVIRRSGVTVSVMQRNRSVQTPVSLVRSLSGLALRLPVNAAQTSHAAGPSEDRKKRILMVRNRKSIRKPHSVVSPQVQPRVEGSHLIAVAIEHQRLALQK